MEKKNTKKTLIAAIALVLVIAAAILCYQAFKPQAAAGSKNISVEVLHADGSTADFSYATDAEYLSEVLLDEGLIEGEDSEYGLYITTVDGEAADYDADGAYWAIYVNGEYGSYGADQQPVEDGDEYTLAYEVYEQ